MWYPTMFVFLSDLVQCPQVHPTFFFFKMHPPLAAMQETQIQFLSQEDILEMEMATHFSIFAWRIPWTEEPGGLQSMGLQRVGHDWVTNTHTHIHTRFFFSAWALCMLPPSFPSMPCLSHSLQLISSAWCCPQASAGLVLPLGKIFICQAYKSNSPIAISPLESPSCLFSGIPSICNLIFSITFILYYYWFLIFKIKILNFF